MKYAMWPILYLKVFKQRLNVFEKDRIQKAAQRESEKMTAFMVTVIIVTVGFERLSETLVGPVLPFLVQDLGGGVTELGQLTAIYNLTHALSDDAVAQPKGADNVNGTDSVNSVWNAHYVDTASTHRE